MGAVSLGDLAQSFLLRRQNVVLKTDMQRLSTELTTGRVTDAATHLSGDIGPLLAIDSSLSRLKSYATAANEAALFSGAMQTALGTIGDLSTDISTTLLAAGTVGSVSQITAAGISGHQYFETAIAAMNTRFADRTVFAGTVTAGRAVIGPDDILAVLETEIGNSGAVSASDIQSTVANWFDSPAGYGAVAYRGDTGLSPIDIAAGEEANLGVTANDPAIRSTLKGLAMAALLDRGVLAGQPAARQDLARRAGESLLDSQTERASLSARLGLIQAQIETATSRNSAESSTLQIARTGLLSADPFETASKLAQTQSQLEKIYAITARMSRLSLLDYIR